MLLRIPLSRVLGDDAGNQFVGIEFNPTARTHVHTFRLALRQLLQLSLRSLNTFLPDSDSYVLGRPNGPRQLFSLFPSTPTNTRGLYTGQWVVGFH